MSEKDQFLRYMIRLILNQTFQPGDRLPTESELAGRCGIAKTNVHLGLKELERLGFIKIVPRHASYVADFRDGCTLETIAAIMKYSPIRPERCIVDAFMELREMVALGGIRWMARQPDPTHLQELYGILEEMEALVCTAPATRPVFLSVLNRFLICMFTKNGNMVFQILLYSAREIAHMLWEMLNEAIEEDDLTAAYRRVLDRIAAGDVNGATQTWCAWNDTVTPRYLHVLYPDEA